MVVGVAAEMIMRLVKNSFEDVMRNAATPTTMAGRKRKLFACQLKLAV